MPRFRTASVRSETRIGAQPPPAWARFLVVVCHVFARVETPEQWFGAKAAAETWARTLARHAPATIGANGCQEWWILVYALPSDPRERSTRGLPGQCYLSYDPGGIQVKRHPVWRTHGRPSAWPAA